MTTSVLRCNRIQRRKEGDSNDDAFGGKPDDDRRKSDGSHGGDEDPGRDGGEKGESV